ncbi:hypothetical protein RB619_09325 [Flavobacterium sp. LHD-80]|uniref:hypothetical protein n=1 Tax=Flavobacterium sp. LHD-80 TaxID=3071411 RepID=UPI0027E1ECC4|nr:hypothetical protein [Flavobacterium sp. LHD-80]MDQ6470840.1 hypothetical protein [Flavobacterium sp. LHD-80]
MNAFLFIVFFIEDFYLEKRSKKQEARFEEMLNPESCEIDFSQKKIIKKVCKLNAYRL